MGLAGGAEPSAIVHLALTRPQSSASADSLHRPTAFAASAASMVSSSSASSQGGGGGSSMVPSQFSSTGVAAGLGSMTSTAFGLTFTSQSLQSP